MKEERLDHLHLIVSRDGRDQSLTIHQDVDLYASLLTADCTLSHSFRKDRKGWLQVVLGDVDVNDRHPLLGLTLDKVDLGQLLDLLLDFVGDQLFYPLGTRTGEMRENERGADGEARVFGPRHFQEGGDTRQGNHREGDPSDPIPLNRGASQVHWSAFPLGPEASRRRTRSPS